MMKQYLIIIFACMLSLNTVAQQYGSFKDPRDGKVYKTVIIGDQEWMAINLDVDRFMNGDLIPEAKTIDEWARYTKEGKPAWCYYENNPGNAVRTGKLYNWYAIKDPRGLAPSGYRIPNDEDWNRLRNYAGTNEPGWKLKSSESWVEWGVGWKDNPDGWDKCLTCWDWSTKKRERTVCKDCNNTKRIWKDPKIWKSARAVGYGSNELGFTGLPGGELGLRFTNKGFNGSWWCSTYIPNVGQIPSNYYLSALHNEFYTLGPISPDWIDLLGLSVRCIKGSDSRTLISNTDAASPKNKISNNNFPNSGIVQPNNKESNTSIAKNNNNSINNSPLFNCTDLVQKIKYKIDNTKLNFTGDVNKDADNLIETIIKPAASEYITSIISNANRVVSKEERDAISTQTISCIKSIDFKFNNTNTPSNRNNNTTRNADPLSNLISDYLFYQTFKSPTKTTNTRQTPRYGDVNTNNYDLTTNAWQCSKCGVLSKGQQQPGRYDNGNCTIGSSHTYGEANTTQGYQCKKCGRKYYLLNRGRGSKGPCCGEFGNCSIGTNHDWREF